MPNQLKVVNTDANFICLRNAFRDTDNEADFIFNGLNDSVGSSGWWDVKYSCVGLSFFHRLAECRIQVAQDKARISYFSNGSKDGQAQVGLASLLWRDSSNHFCAICEGFCDVESALANVREMRAGLFRSGWSAYRLPSQTLAKDLRILVDEQVPNRVIVGFASSSLRERPASNLSGLSAKVEIINTARALTRAYK